MEEDRDGKTLEKREMGTHVFLCENDPLVADEPHRPVAMFRGIGRRRVAATSSAR